MSESNVEKGILEAFRRGLKRAVSDAQGVNWNGVDSIKEHKLLLMGIRNFPEVQDHVTIQWYLDGDMLPHLDDQPGPIQTNAGVSSGPIPEVDEIKEFYAEEMVEPLEDILTADTFYWLKTYYENREVPFKQAYLANMDILLHITQCARFCDLEYPNTTLPEDLVSPIEEASIDLKRELIKYPLFRNLPPFVTEFTRVATQVMTWLEEQDLENPDDRAEYTTLLNHLGSFYYKGVWRPISNRIGYYTIHGPAEEDDREFHITNLKRARQNFLKLSNQFRSRANDYGLRVEIRNERIPKLRPEERNFQELLQWEPEDDTAEQVTTA
ncbi:hypothetical protein JK354_18600 [Haloferax volcanii]|uniref:Uncharacterized protein n=2 Tax=Haloferax volcanii TaxID=2246 RepID=D4H0B6_HALVD|nr:hypothetical protein [Haloferax volcanii]ADE05266.1 uncharacterized protein HVO_C0028 [Haloferax volcanii DS2]MBS8121153.1 hypothetical protein [Haloferax volcanii]MBS8126164.1 hypothetical protein [Haloferax volcanii]MBS8130018.1 hypothetical protein [Haloferax volcanii]MBS8133882.1 hypothetical protein [Haloferax volcanii]